MSILKVRLGELLRHARVSSLKPEYRSSGIVITVLVLLFFCPGGCIDMMACRDHDGDLFVSGSVKVYPLCVQTFCVVLLKGGTH